MRPYPGPLRARVFALLASAGVAVETPSALGDGTSNEDAIDEDATRRALERFLAATRPSAGRGPGLTPAAERG